MWLPLLVSKKKLNECDVLWLVKSFPKLETLDLSFTRINDQGVNALSQLASLYKLNLRGTRVTDHVASALSKIKNLRYVELGCTRITDRGAHEVVRQHSYRQVGQKDMGKKPRHLRRHRVVIVSR